MTTSFDLIGKGLLPFMGGMRRFIPFLLDAAKSVAPMEDWHKWSFHDMTCGSCAGSAAFGFYGMSVSANDLALRSCIPARAIFGGRAVHRGLLRAGGLLVPTRPRAGRQEKRQGLIPEFLHPVAADMFDTLYYAAERGAMPEEDADCFRYMAIRWVLLMKNYMYFVKLPTFDLTQLAVQSKLWAQTVETLRKPAEPMLQVAGQVNALVHALSSARHAVPPLVQRGDCRENVKNIQFDRPSFVSLNPADGRQHPLHAVVPGARHAAVQRAAARRRRHDARRPVEVADPRYLRPCAVRPLRLLLRRRRGGELGGGLRRGVRDGRADREGMVVSLARLGDAQVRPRSLEEALMVSPIDKIKIQNQWLRKLTSVEPLALKMCTEIDLATCVPEVIVADKDHARDLFDYWRVVLSSEPQSPHFAGAGRSLALLIRDRTSGGFLGVVGLSDPPNHWTQLINHLGWKGQTDLRLANQHRIVMMRRCLPVYEFGQMTGGKLLALAATSREVIRLLELRYSFQYLFFGIRTLHGKGSQYNRLHQRGIELLDVDETDHGFYGMELRKKAVSFLKGETDAYGKTRHLHRGRPGRLLARTVALRPHDVAFCRLHDQTRPDALPAVRPDGQQAPDPRQTSHHGGRRWH